MMKVTERDLERLAQELGTAPAVRVDPERVAARVVERLRAGEQLPPGRSIRMGRWGLAAAAAVALLVGGDALRRDAGTPTAAPAAPVAVSGLDADGLAEALDSLVYGAPASEFVGWGIGTMTEDELETLLSEMEGA